MDFSQKPTQPVNSSLILETLKLSLQTSTLKTQTIKQLVRSADPTHHRQALAEVSRVLGNQSATEMNIEKLY
jgi:hypothetical protein